MVSLPVVAVSATGSVETMTATGSVERSLRPMARPAMISPPAGVELDLVAATVAQVTAALADVESAPRSSPTPPATAPSLAPQPAVAAIGEDSGSPARSLRPRIRPASLSLATPAAPPAEQATPQPVSNPAGFDRWVQGFRPRALSQGISPATFDRAFARAEFLPKVIELDRSQSEFTKTIGDYLSTAVSDTRVSNGRAAVARHKDALTRIEAQYGVDRDIVAAVWGMETNFGSYRGGNGVVSSLATLAFEGRRASFFETQLVDALKILDAGDTTPERMKGSWAGAMGHTQFMPSSYLEYAVDFTGDGRRDIWDDNPSDALASTANYLAKFGWIAGQPWGVEVRLPAGFDYAQADGRKKMPSDWAALGVRNVAGDPVPDFGSARILLPAGANGVAFLVFKNFDVIRRYNPSDAYALGVGHLGDRIGGAGPFVAAWPQDERGLKRDERKELQALLGRKGHGAGTPDGIIGPNTQAAIRSFQSSVGLVPDGYASLTLLERLRR
ncbi:lytic murein transglycosylase [Pseudooceanicola sp. 502str34]